MLNCVFYIYEVDLGLNSFILYICVGRLPFQEYWFNLCVGKHLVLHRLWFNPIWVAKYFLLNGFCLKLLSAFEMSISAEVI
jgi:hypothetical protein